MLHATFDELLEAVENLPPEAQEDLAELIRHRLAERGRQRVVAEVREARSEFESGTVKPTSVEDLLREIET